EVKRLYNMGGTLHLASSQNTKLTNGLVGLWSFDQADIAGTTAYDRSGQGNNGTLTNGPTRVGGKIGQGLGFDGSDDYVGVATITGIPTGQQARTVSFWIKPNAIVEGNSSAIVSIGDSGINQKYMGSIRSFWCFP